MATERKKQQDRDRMQRIRSDQKQSIEHMTDLLSRMIPGKVKDLKWDEDGEVWRSRTSIGEYVIGMVGIHHGWVNNGLTGWHFSTSVECAKLECQTDYEQRILEALE